MARASHCARSEIIFLRLYRFIADRCLWVTRTRTLSGLTGFLLQLLYDVVWCIVFHTQQKSDVDLHGILLQLVSNPICISLFCDPNHCGVTKIRIISSFVYKRVQVKLNAMRRTQLVICVNGLQARPVVVSAARHKLAKAVVVIPWERVVLISCFVFLKWHNSMFW